MARRIVAALQRVLNPPYQEPPVHFHRADGSPEVCYDAACARPRLSV
jgi:hypothetical protein